MQGVLWSLAQAMVERVTKYTTDNGEVRCSMSLLYFGGNLKVPVDVAKYEEYRKFEGKMVAVSGSLSHKENRFGVTCRFELSELKEVKA